MKNAYFWNSKWAAITDGVWGVLLTTPNLLYYFCLSQSSKRNLTCPSLEVNKGLEGYRRRDSGKGPMKTYILYGETRNSDGWFTVFGFEKAESPNEALAKLQSESYWTEVKPLLTAPEIRIREVGELNYAYLGSAGVPEGA